MALLPRHLGAPLQQSALEHPLAGSDVLFTTIGMLNKWTPVEWLT
jgi:hypothetical protein